MFDQLVAALGQAEDSAAVQALLATALQHASPTRDARPTRKAYPDITYLNLHALGFSLQLEARPSGLVVAAIDIYNHNADAYDKRERNEYEPFPAYPLRVSSFRPAAAGGSGGGGGGGSSASSASASSSPPKPTGSLEVDHKTSGADFVQAWGEPSRKGGGEGPVGRGPAAWMEWTGHAIVAAFPVTAAASGHDSAAHSDATRQTPLQIMVELGGPGARGPRRWEADSAGSSVWKVLTLASPTSAP
ncbi:hypothetical protein OC842_005105 [Tilletia horrida]|uniref:Uncharacterized protein n=1 Tax=Tilletia horrida TaxID=155126 RepID=A0AAN6GCX3_9BASI|nr:hypothetical protein OC842_005105 [Tilletia horrida]